MKDFLTAKEVSILKEAHYSSRFRKSADRIKAILFLNQGFTYEQTAKLLSERSQITSVTSPVVQ